MSEAEDISSFFPAVIGATSSGGWWGAMAVVQGVQRSACRSVSHEGPPARERGQEGNPSTSCQKHNWALFRAKESCSLSPKGVTVPLLSPRSISLALPLYPSSVSRRRKIDPFTDSCLLCGDDACMNTFLAQSAWVPFPCACAVRLQKVKVLYNKSILSLSKDAKITFYRYEGKLIRRGSPSFF